MPIDRSEERPRLPFMPDSESPETISVTPRSRFIVAVFSGTPAQVLRKWEDLANSERNPS